MKKYFSISIVAFFILLVGCGQQNDLKRGEGFVNVKGGKIWYRVVGSGNKTPILLLHGGPGYPSYYLNPLSALGNERPVITFDQLGCGRSDRVADSTLLTLDHYVEQIKTLLEQLKVDDFYLYGHSWGSILATEYCLKYPEGIKGLVLNGVFFNTDLYKKDLDVVISRLPDSIQRPLKQSILNEKQDKEKLDQAMAYFHSHVYRTNPKLSAANDSSVRYAASPVGGDKIWGSSLLVPSGVLKNHDRTKKVGKISAPTLLMGGEHDIAQANTLQYYQSLIPNSQFVIIRNSGHETMHDNLEEELKVLSGFLRKLD
jgi:proline iminopeptidase